MKILLDTAFFLPAVGIAIEGMPEDVPIELLKKGHEISISEITVFEISAKASKYVISGKVNPIEVAQGLSAIIHDKRIERVQIYETPVQTRAFRLKTKLADFIDCLIISSAASTECDALVTEDDAIHKLSKDKEFIKLIAPTKEAFHVARIGSVL